MSKKLKDIPARGSGNRIESINRFLQTSVVIAALIAVALLGVRKTNSIDLGYHLDFGETLYNTGKIVDHTPYIYTLPGPDIAPEDLPAPGPSCWYDSEGNYRFPNANWLSQWFMYLAWKAGGITGISILQFALTAAVFALVLAAMLQMGISKAFSAAGLLMIAVISYSRFNLRPEVFGMLCYSLQFLILARAYKRESITWHAVAAFIFIQLLFVNSHSYTLLSLYLIVVYFIEYYFRAINAQNKGLEEEYKHKKVIMQRIGTAVLGMLTISFLNPWTWRLAILPFETFAYLSKHNIGGVRDTLNRHPWDNILEFRSALSETFHTGLTYYAIIGMLVLAGLAVILQLFFFPGKRKNSGKKGQQQINNGEQQKPRVYFAMILLIIGMTIVGLKMRRNVAIASIAVIPASLLCLSRIKGYIDQLSLASRLNKLKIPALAVLLVLSCFFGYTIVTDRFYLAEKNVQRFGFGFRKTHIPISAAEWLDEHMPGAKVWCDMSSSSTLRFFTNPKKDLPVLSNTWAYPPEILQQNFNYRSLKLPIKELEDKYDIDAIVLRYPWSIPLHRYLVDDRSWEVVHIDGEHAVYAQYNGRYADVVKRYWKMKKDLPY